MANGTSAGVIRRNVTDCPRSGETGALFIATSSCECPAAGLQSRRRGRCWSPTGPPGGPPDLNGPRERDTLDRVSRPLHRRGHEVAVGSKLSVLPLIPLSRFSPQIVSSTTQLLRYQ